MDLIGQINPPLPKRYKFILVAIDYFTKCVKAVALKEVTQYKLINFIEEKIIHRFGTPKSLTIDQGTMFMGKKVVDYAANWMIKMLTSTPYYVQANGQVKTVNKTIIGMIKKCMRRQPRNWHDALSQVLWAYRCSPMGLTWTMPYKLVFRHNAILPIKVNLQTIFVWQIVWITHWRLLECYVWWVIWIRARKNWRVGKYSETKRIHRDITIFMLKNKAFQLGDLVWKTILPFEKESRIIWKWSSNLGRTISSH